MVEPSSASPQDGEVKFARSLGLFDAKVPRYTDTLELSFFHESDGVLEVRSPALQVLDPDSAEDCENTR